MKHNIHSWRRVLAQSARAQSARALCAQALCALALAAAGSAQAATVSMPTTTGAQDFDSAAFASSIPAGPAGGSFGCFTAGAIGSCTSAALQLAVLGSDLANGLTLGTGAQIELAFSKPGNRVVIWEAGNFTSADDFLDLQVSVHTAAGWSAAHNYAPEHIGPVLNDTRPSGYATNNGIFLAEDFGLAPGAAIDAVRLHAFAGEGHPAHADVLAVAVVPEPGTGVLMLAGLLGATGLLRRRSQGR